MGLRPTWYVGKNSALESLNNMLLELSGQYWLADDATSSGRRRNVTRPTFGKPNIGVTACQQSNVKYRISYTGNLHER